MQNIAVSKPPAAGAVSRLASAPEVVAHFRSLEQRWLKFAEKADAKGEGLGIRRKAPATVSAHT